MKNKFKGLLKSKTFWINILVALLALFNEFNGKIIPTKYAIEIIAVLNIIIRFVTNTSLEDK